MFLVQCSILLLPVLLTPWCRAYDDEQAVSSSLSSDSIDRTYHRNKAFVYAYKNFHDLTAPLVNALASTPKGHHKSKKNKHFDPLVPPIPPGFVPPHPYYYAPPYYMPPPPPPPPAMPYHGYPYPQYYPQPPGPQPYVYPVAQHYTPPSEVKDPSTPEEKKTTQNLWLLYQQLKAKFETSTASPTDPPLNNADNLYYRHQNNRRNLNSFGMRDHRRYVYQPNQHNYHEMESKTMSTPGGEPFEKYSQAKYRTYERPSSRQTIVESQTPTTIIKEEKRKPTSIPDFDKEIYFETKMPEGDETKEAQKQRWHGIIRNIKSSLGLKEDSESGTEPIHVQRDIEKIRSLFLTDGTPCPLAEKYNITLVYNAENSLDQQDNVGFNWEEEEKLAAKSTKDWISLFKEYKEKYEFPDYVQHKRHIERSEFKHKKRMLYKLRGMTYDDGRPNDDTTPGENPFLNLGRDPYYYPGNIKGFVR